MAFPLDTKFVAPAAYLVPLPSAAVFQPTKAWSVRFREPELVWSVRGFWPVAVCEAGAVPPLALLSEYVMEEFHCAYKVTSPVATNVFKPTA